MTKVRSLLIAILSVASVAYSQTYTEGPWTYIVNDFDEVIIQSYSGPGGLVTIPSSIGGNQVKQVGDGSTQIFGSWNTTPTGVVIPNGVARIGDRAFQYFWAYVTGGGLTNVTIPNSVTNIGNYAFEECRGLTNVTIPNNVKIIGHRAFFRCSSLTDVTIPNSVTFTLDWAFAQCGGLTNVTIGSGVTNIGNLAFQECVGLTSVTIPSSVTRIGPSAFSGCSALTNVTIGRGVTNIGDIAFYRCFSLTNIGVDPSNTAYASLDGVLFNKAATTLIQWPGGKQGAYTVPNGVRDIGDRAFEVCGGLTSVTIPSSVTSIGTWAFYGCAQLKEVYCRGNMPSVGRAIFGGIPVRTVFYYSGSTGWSPTFGNWPTQPYELPPEISEFSRQTNGFSMSWSPVGAVDIERRGSLTDGQWTTILSNTTGSTYLDTNTPNERAFYRVLVR